MLTNDKDKLDGHRTYIDGKLRRYGLLFSVNGGIFAVAKLVQTAPSSFGALTIPGLAAGAALFTVLMWLDIWAFATMMRWKFFGGKDVFQSVGQIVLTAICALLIAGWLLVANNYWIILVVAIACAAAAWKCIHLTLQHRGELSTGS